MNAVEDNTWSEASWPLPWGGNAGLWFLEQQKKKSRFGCKQIWIQMGAFLLTGYMILDQSLISTSLGSFVGEMGMIILMSQGNCESKWSDLCKASACCLDQLELVSFLLPFFPLFLPSSLSEWRKGCTGEKMVLRAVNKMLFWCRDSVLFKNLHVLFPLRLSV